MAHCLVTGGAGFIGSHLVEGLLRRGHRVRVLDDFATGTPHNLQAVEAQLAREGIPYALEVVEGSILDPQAVAAAMAGIDYVFHQAALPSVAFSLQDPLRSNRVNVEGTLCVLLAARDAGVRRLIYAGSSSAYGDSPELPKREDLPPNPLSPYAVAKLTGEHYCRLFTQLYRLETVTLRYFNVFGPRQNPDSQYAAVIPKFITALLRHEPLPLFGDGLQSRDFTYVDNVVHGNLLAMTAPEVAGQVLNVANGSRTTLRQLIAYLEELTGRRAEVAVLPPRPGDVRHSQADITRAKTLLGFEPLVDVKEGLARTLKYYQQRLAVSPPCT
ncbi:MAG: UDP-glucose 4-epimerase-like protein [Candidatus Tectimicrobiota bacterium]|nr:MAG: UDP-glucose 4-epimerase-like protein [Candidatus Tectomicrobia bacterium]